MGTAGGILVLILGYVFATGAVKNSLMSYTKFFGLVAAIMLIALVVFRLTVDEPRFVREMEEESAKYDLDEATPEEMAKGETFDPGLGSVLVHGLQRRHLQVLRLRRERAVVGL